MAELADAGGLNPPDREVMRVRSPPRARVSSWCYVTSVEHGSAARNHQFNAEACEAIESVCVRLAELAPSALEHGDLSAARSAIGRGLRALPLNEPLYSWRMRLEAQAGNRGDVRAAFEELCSRLSDFDIEIVPSASTSALFEQLWSGPPERRSA